MQTRDGRNQGAAEPGAAAVGASAGGISAIERLEQIRQVRRGDTGPRVLDCESQTATGGNRLEPHLDCAAHGRELQRILEQMIHQSYHELRVHEHGGLRDTECARDAEVALREPLAQPIEPFSDEPLDIRRHSLRRHQVSLGSRHEQQVLAQLGQPLDLLEPAAQHALVFSLAPRRAERHLDFAAQRGERRPQLVTHIRRQPPLRGKAALQPLQHAVQDRHQTFVFLGIGVGQNPLIQRPRLDACGLRGDLGDWSNGGRCEVPGAHQGRRSSRHDDGRQHQQQITPQYIRGDGLLERSRSGPVESSRREEQPCGHRRRKPQRQLAAQRSAHASARSGVCRRNPTPRTVSINS